MTLAEARGAWRVAKAAVDRGEDPAATKAEARRKDPDTVRGVAEDFIAKYARPRNRTADEVARMFALHLYPNRRAHLRRKHGERDCGHCGRRFIPEKPTGRWCSHRCRMLAKYATKRAEATKARPRNDDGTLATKPENSRATSCGTTVSAAPKPVKRAAVQVSRSDS